MYQELQVFEYSFKSRPIWGIRGKDRSLPSFAVGDFFEHKTLPELAARLSKPPEEDKVVPPLKIESLFGHITPPVKTQVLVITGIKHVFQETGQGPEADHLIQITVDWQDADSRHEKEMALADEETARELQRGDFYKYLAKEQAEAAATKIFNAALAALIAELKSQPAHGIDSEAATEWQEAAHILQAEDHYLAEELRSRLQGSVFSALKKLSRAEHIALWLAYEDSDFEERDCIESDLFAQQKCYDPLEHYSEALAETEEDLFSALQSELMCDQVGD